MRLQLSKQIVGIRDRGLPTEVRHIHADKGDRITVLFDNTYETATNFLMGHYVCVKDDLHFPVFHSQIEWIIKDKEQINVNSDLFYPSTAEELENTILE